MAELKDWEYTPDWEQRWTEWIKPGGHGSIADVRNEKLAWTPLKKPLAQCTVALLTTGGVHLRSQAEYDLLKKDGDWTYREIPADTPSTDLTIAHTHYDHPQGKLFGPPFDAQQQRSILRATLEAVVRIDRPGTILEYPGRWRAPRAGRADCMPVIADPDLQQIAANFENTIDSLECYRLKLIARRQRYQAEGRDPVSYRPIASNLKRIETLQQLLESEVYDQLRVVVDGIGVLSNVDEGRWI